MICSVSILIQWILSLQIHVVCVFYVMFENYLLTLYSFHNDEDFKTVLVMVILYKVINSLYVTSSLVEWPLLNKI